MRFSTITVIVAYLAALGALGISAAASATTLTGATITGIRIDTQIGSMAFVSINISKGSTNPTCSTNVWSFVLPLTNALQNQMLAQLLSARATQTPVNLTGNGLCDTWGDV